MGIEQLFQKTIAIRERPIIASDVINTRNIPLAQPLSMILPGVAEIDARLSDYPIIDPNNLDTDLVVKGLGQMPHALLASWAALDEPFTAGWVGRALEARDGQAPQVFRNLNAYIGLKAVEGTPQQDWDKYENNLMYFYRTRRDTTALLLWPELAVRAGIDFSNDYMNPLAQLQLEIGNNPAQVSPESRIAGMKIQRNVREKLGRVRFAQMSRTIGDGIYTFHTFALQALSQRSFYQAVLSRDLQEHGIQVQPGTFGQVIQEDQPEQSVNSWVRSSEMLQFMQAVIAQDFDSWHAELHGQDKGVVRSANSLIDKLCIGMVDPGILAPLRDFSWMEKTISERLSLQPGDWYRFHQKNTILRQKVSM